MVHDLHAPLLQLLLFLDHLEQLSLLLGICRSLEILHQPKLHFEVPRFCGVHCFGLLWVVVYAALMPAIYCVLGHDRVQRLLAAEGQLMEILTALAWW